MAYSLVQQHAVGITFGDGQPSGDGKGSINGWFAWPTPVTAGNLLVVGWTCDDTTFGANPGTGWTQAGSAVVSTAYAGMGLQVWYKIADVSEATRFFLDGGQTWGNRSAAIGFEFTGGTKTFDKTGSFTGSMSTYTALPSLSVTPTATASLIVWFDSLGYWPNDGTQTLRGVSKTSTDGTTFAPNNGERLSSGDLLACAMTAGYKLSSAAGANASSGTLTWAGAGTTVPGEGVQQRVVVFAP